MDKHTADLLRMYDEWSEERAAISYLEEVDHVSPSTWQDSDDAAADLLSGMAEALAEAVGYEGPESRNDPYDKGNDVCRQCLTVFSTENVEKRYRPLCPICVSDKENG
jgi:formamidopyrimidine-DNA glycosylase